MANMSGTILIKDVNGWDLSQLPAPYNTWSKTGSTYKLNAYILKALHNFALGSKSEIGVVRINDGTNGGAVTYVSQWERPDGTILAYATSNGALHCSKINPVNGKYEPLPQMGNKNTVCDTSSLMILYMLIQADVNRNKGNVGGITWQLLQSAADDVAANGFVSEGTARLISDTLQAGFESSDPATRIEVTFKPGNMIPLLKEDRVKSNEFHSGTIVCGDPKILKPAEARTVARNRKNQTIGSMKADPEIKAYVDSRQWTTDEELLIQKFPDDMKVPEPIVKAIMRFIRSQNMKNPFVNFGWRGITGLGKSTGVSIMSCVLHTPLVWMTCSSGTDREFFLSCFVPEGRTEYVASRLPSMDDIMIDPAAAYEMLTHHHKANVTDQEVLEAYGAAYARLSNETPSYKLVASDYVTALERGYIVEIQEASRVRDQGVLTALNNLDRPGAIIPMIDGSKKVRHKNAITFWTDNVGYATCKNLEPSVKRRIDTIETTAEMLKEDVMRRLHQNLPDFNDDSLLNKMYDIWTRIISYCHDKDITDGEVSIVELERWAACVQMEGEEVLFDACADCVLTKAADNFEELDELRTFVQTELAKAI